MHGTQCPRCHEPVRVPDVNGDTLLQCPWCREEFRCEEVLRELPPMLVIVGPESSGAEAFQDVESYGFEGPAFSVQTAERSLGETTGRISDRSARPRKKGENPLVSLLKVGGGGAAGILIALLILQSMGRLPDMGVWPFRGPDSAFFGSGRSVRAMPPRESDWDRKERADGGDRQRRSEGRTLPLPSLPEFELGANDQNGEASGASPGAGTGFEASIEACEEILSSYRELESPQADVNTEERSRELSSLVQRFIVGMNQVTKEFVASKEISLGQQALLDSLVIGFSGEEEFLRETVLQMAQSLPLSEDGVASSNGVWLMGKVDQSDSEWSLSIPGTRNRTQPIEMDDEDNSLVAGKVYFIIAIGDLNVDPAENQARIPVVYARQLQRD